MCRRTRIAMPMVALDSPNGSAKDSSASHGLPLSKHLLGVLAEQRRTAREAPRGGAGDEGAAGIGKRGTELGVLDLDEEAAIAQMGIVEVLVGRADRRPRKALRLADAIDLVG